MALDAVTELLGAMAHLRREKRRCERRLDELRAALAASPTDAVGGARADRSKAGWTDAKRQAVSERMRAYWAARRTDDEPAEPPAPAGERVPAPGRPALGLAERNG